jgi:proline dehydrogenase
MEISFQNTEIAFKIKSDKALLKAYLLFRLIGNNRLVGIGSGLTHWALRVGFPVNWAVKPTIYSHFVGGETIDSCKPAVRALEKFGVKAILDYSVEGKENPEDIQHAFEETLRSVRNSGEDPNIPFAVFKPTAFTLSSVLEKVSAGEVLSPEEQEEKENFYSRIDTLCRTAWELGKPILIDAEDFCYQAHIDEVTESMMQKYNTKEAVVFNTFQMYRTDRLSFLSESISKARAGGYFLGAKFVRGAYMERERERARRLAYPSPIHSDKAGTDKAYNDALRLSMENIDVVSIFNGTHNEESSRLLAELMIAKGMAPNDPRCWFSQLYGMSDHISFNLAHYGFNVAKYLPYGPVKHVLPYLIRRTEENTSVAGQTGRELSLILQERQRRRGS